MVIPLSIYESSFKFCLLLLATMPALNAGNGAVGRLVVPEVISLSLLKVSSD